MSKFNLSFRGEILPGYKPERVKSRFAKLFAIDDPQRVEMFFSGKPISLRRNLDRKEAADIFRKLHDIGLSSELVRVDGDGIAAPAVEHPATESEAPTDTPPKTTPRRMDHDILQRAAGRVDQSWAVPSRKPKSQANKSPEADQAAKIASHSKAATDPEVIAREKAASAAAAEAKRIAVQESARNKAEAARALAAEEQRIAEQDAARRKAEAEVAKALAAEQRRVAREDAARMKAEAAEARRVAREETARKKAEAKAAREAAAEAKQIAREAAARNKAETQAARKRADEEASRLAAVQAKRFVQEEEARQRAADELSRLAAAEAKRLADEQVERRKADVIQQAENEEASKKAAAAKQAAIMEAALRKAAAEKAEHLALEEEAKYLAAAGAARTRAREEHLKAEAAARMAAQEHSGTTDLFELEEFGGELEAPTSNSPAATGPQAASNDADIDATPPVAKGTPPTEARDKSIAPAKVLAKRLRTRIEVPTRVRIDSSVGPGDPAIKPRRPSQPGAPNLFSILPFRNSTAVRERAQRSQTYHVGGLTAALLAVIALIALSLRFAAAPAPMLLTGPDSIVASPAGQLLLLVNTLALSHDRSGVAVEEIILPAVPDSSARQPLQFISEEQYLLTAEPTDLEREHTASQLLRCHTPESSCAPALTDSPDEAVAGLIAHTLDSALYIANHRDQLLRKYSANGKLLAEVSAAVPVVATLRLEDGLIYMNSSQGPAISVFRPDSTNFGTQLDEILLLTPVAATAKFSKVRDFVRLAGFWWVILEDVESGQARVFQFDSQWGYTREIEMAEGFNPQQLLSWGEKILIRDKQQSVIPRFNSNGEAEVSFESESLAALILEQQANASSSSILWRICLALMTTITICACIFAYTHKIRSLVYKSGSVPGAEPIEDYFNVITWLDPASNRRSRFLQLGILYFLGCFGAGAVAVGLGVSTSELFAVLIALSGPSIGIIMLYRSSIGNIGHSGETLALVDHNKLYHIGRGAQVHYRNRFLIVGDVVVYIGTSLLPTFDRKQLQQLIPLAEAGIKVERKAVWIKLIQARHPLALGALASLLCLSTAIVLLLL